MGAVLIHRAPSNGALIRTLRVCGGLCLGSGSTGKVSAGTDEREEPGRGAAGSWPSAADRPVGEVLFPVGMGLGNPWGPHCGLSSARRPLKLYLLLD